MMRALLTATLLFIIAAAQSAAQHSTTRTILSYDDLNGWHEDNHQAALDVFLETCQDMGATEWQTLCALGTNQQNAKVFFELFFRPVLIEDGTPGLFTGYFEPELNGSRRQSAKFRFPLYRVPPELSKGTQWFSRVEIQTQGVLRGRGLEIAWVDNPVDAFFLQIQGSGRVRLQDGSSLRVGFGGANGHRRVSIGKEMVRRGIYQPHQVSLSVIRNWVGRNPTEGLDLLRADPSFVFFREIGAVPSSKGPLGAMNRSITAMRSLAVDSSFVQLGAPIWLEKGGLGKMNRLMIAQDTGSAIKGAQRADIFFGTGAAAGKAAGQIKDPGRIVVLMPIQEAYALAQGFEG